MFKKVKRMNTSASIKETLASDIDQVAEVLLESQERWYSYVIDRCIFSRLTLANLVQARLGGEVVMLDHHELPGAPCQSIAKPRVKALLYVLPDRLGELLDALLFLVRFLYLYQGENKQIRVRVVLLCNLPPCWLYDTLRSLVPDDACLQWIVLLPKRSSLSEVNCALAWQRGRGHLMQWASETRQETCCRGLTKKEVLVLWDMLHKGVGILTQARQQGVSTKTIYSRYNAARRKIGVDSQHSLLFWPLSFREVFI